jgi:hypothetical protein
MNTPKAAYWFALALFAVAFHSEYQRGAFPSLHRVASHAGSTMCRLTTKVERTIAMARLIIERPGPSSGELLARLDASQLADATRLAEDGAETAREEAQDRAEMVRDQIREQVRGRVRGQVRAQAEIVRAQTEMQRAEIRRIHVLSESQVRISNALDRSVISVTPHHCPQSAIRVEVPSIDLRMNDLHMSELHIDDSADDDADSR